ncbi:MAG TPA: ATP-dependent helicase, partial [Anaerovoracaceae bacterium]|nr:ATP-dependent helicase [Anaerovoracaceae bacterium]
VEIADIKKIFTYWKIQKWTRHTVQNHINRIAVRRIKAPERMREAIDKRQEISRFILEYLYDLYGGEKKKQEEEQKRHEPAVLFSVNELKDAYNKGQVHMTFSNVSLKEIEDALLFLQKIGALKLEGSLMVIYNAMHIERLESDNYKKYKKEDYSQLEKHYESKTQQIHIVGKYASDMIDDYKGALQFVDDYFQMDYNEFLKKHFPKRKDRARISKTITEGKFTEIFGGLSAAQLRIVNDSNSPYIVVAAGPGSGKTKLLVHKLAALMIMEDVRAEQLLMVTFSRAAATEFKQKLGKLIGTAANYVDIKTFHSYCFDLLGKVGSLEKSNAIVKEATEKIKSGQASLNRITKTAMVIDEAQDMDLAEYEFVKAMIDQNEGMRVIAVGDDDQNIFEFRGSSSEYMERFINDYGAKFYELTENYRSKANIVEFSNTFVKYLSHRLKKADINAYRKEGGGIRIYQYMNTSLIQPLVERVCEDSPKTNTAVLTEVNDDAQMIAGFLNDKGISARLIQSNEGFNLSNLLEIRFFMERIRIYDEPHAISKEVWEEGKNALEERFEKSADYSVCLNLLKAFEKNYPNTKYKSDFDVFIKESNLEDFFSRQKGTVTVSTIHKAKGREFDKVYLMLKNGVGRSDESRRKIYVALTRAKNDLTIFCNGNFFEKFVSAGVKYKKVEETYPEPTEFIVQLAFKDAYLNQFFTCQKSIDRLSSGMTLQVDDIGCYDRDNNMVLRFSRRFFGEMERIRAKNFYPTAAKIRHIVYWKKDGIDREIKILLVDVFFKLRFH